MCSVVSNARVNKDALRRLRWVTADEGREEEAGVMVVVGGAVVVPETNKQ